jgi:hypothetical protein
MKITEDQKKSENQMNRLTDAPLSPSTHNNEVEATRESDNVAGAQELSLHNYDERWAVSRTRNAVLQNTEKIRRKDGLTLKCGHSLFFRVAQLDTFSIHAVQ